MTDLREASSRIIVALDVPDMEGAFLLAEKLAGKVGCMKVGKELFTAVGPAVVTGLKERGVPVFLDLKYHDIPNTARGAARSAARLGAAMFTVHTSGGFDMMKAACEGAEEGAKEAGLTAPIVLGVTVLTSIDQVTYNQVGFYGDVVEGVERLAVLAKRSGVGGVVCSPNEIAVVRAAVGDNIKLITPGVRPAGEETGDQKRVMTPSQAISAGADMLVIGRPITKAKDPALAAERIAAEIAEAL